MSGSVPPPAALSQSRLTTLPLCAGSAWGSREGLSLAASLGVGLALWASARYGALPAAGATLAFLIPAVWWDVRALRIPNLLTLPALLAVLLWSGLAGGWAGLGAALLAAGVVLVLLFGPFAWGWLGAGDVKALLVLAALWGLDSFLPALWWMLVTGGVGAIALLAVHAELGDLVRRWGRSLWLTLASRRPHYVPAAPGTAARQGLPFALAMGLGCAAYGVFGMPL